MNPPISSLVFKPNHKTERPIVVVDGMNVFIRHFCVNETTTTGGEPVGGVVGFVKYINRLVSDFVPRRLYIVWEQGGASPRRKQIYPGYKANRAKDKTTFKNINQDSTSRKWILDDTENKIKQLHLLTNILKQLPVCQIYIPDTEADDIVAYLLRFKLQHENCRKILVSSDKDFYQLLENPSIEIYDPARKILVSGQKVLEEYKISPRNFCLARTLVGDNSDNIDGIDGIGLKTVAKRLPELAEVDADWQPKDIMGFCQKRIDEKSKVKAYQDILNNRDIIDRNWQLMYLDSSSLSASQLQKVDYTVENFKPQMNKLGLIKTMIDAGVVTDIDFDRVSVQLKTTLIE